MTDLDDVQAGWNQAAQEDAMGHILTTGSPWTQAAFFEHGREEIRACMARLDDLGLRGPRHLKAMDFGCGVGRLTQALAEFYDWVEGVDISQSMVDQARELNRQGEKVRYRVLRDRLVARPGSFDLIYSMLVLQHMPREYSHGYIRTFLRLLHPDGLAVFNIPEGPDVPHTNGCLSMWGTPRSVVEGIVRDAGGMVVDVEVVANHETWIPYRYTAKRAVARPATVAA